MHANSHRYLALDNETPQTIAKKLGVDVHKLCDLNVGLHPGFKKTARLKENTAVRVPNSVRLATLHQALEANNKATGQATARPTTDASAVRGRVGRPKRRNPRYVSDDDVIPRTDATDEVISSRSGKERKSKRVRSTRRWSHDDDHFTSDNTDRGVPDMGRHGMSDQEPPSSASTRLRLRGSVPLVLPGRRDGADADATSSRTRVSRRGTTLAWDASAGVNAEPDGQEYSWQAAAEMLHARIMAAPEATHFLTPVDTDEYPDYAVRLFDNNPPRTSYLQGDQSSVFHIGSSLIRSVLNYLSTAGTQCTIFSSSDKLLTDGNDSRV